MPRKQAPTPVTTSRTRLAANIKSARVAKQMTQHELAVTLGINEAQTVSNWERGLYKPSDENLQALSHALGRDLAWFYTDHAPSPEPSEQAA